MEEKQAPPPYQNTDNQGVLGCRDNPGYDCIASIPQPVFNPAYSNPVVTQPVCQYNHQLSDGNCKISHHVTVVQTPPVMYPPDHCALSWFACLCCFWPVGICAIINSSNTRDAINRGDLAAANIYSQSARKFATTSIVLGICIIVLCNILRLALISRPSSNSS